MDLDNAGWGGRAVAWAESWIAQLGELSFGQLAWRGLCGVATWLLLRWAVRRFAGLQWVEEARRSLRGYCGELKVRWLLRLWFKGCHQWHDVYVACPTGITQVDHVLISRRGIFVLETKNYRSARNTEYWADKAVAQNQWHCRAVAQRLGVKETSLRNIVVMVDGCPAVAAWSGIRRGLLSTLWHLGLEYPKYLTVEEVEARAVELTRHLHPKTPTVVEAHRSQKKYGTFAANILVEWGYDPSEIAGEGLSNEAKNGASGDPSKDPSLAVESERLEAEEAQQAAEAERLAAAAAQQAAESERLQAEAARQAAEAERQVAQQFELLSFLSTHRAQAYPQEHGKFRWSVAEEAVCRSLLEAGASLSAIARASGRTQTALRYRLEPQAAPARDSPAEPLRTVPAS